MESNNNTNSSSSNNGISGGGGNKMQELLQALVRVCKRNSEAAAIFCDHLVTESGDLAPSLRSASAQTVPKLQLLHEQRVLLAASPFPRRLMEKIEQLKDSGVQGIDRYIWLVGHVMADPDLKKLVSIQPNAENPVSLEPTSSPAPGLSSETTTSSASSSPGNAAGAGATSTPHGATSIPHGATTPHSGDGASHRKARPTSDGDGRGGESMWQFPDYFAEEGRAQNGKGSHAVRSPRSAEKPLGVPRALVEGVSYPASPQWNLDRPYLTGKHLFQQDLQALLASSTARRASSEKELVCSGSNNADGHRTTLGGLSPSVQELLLVEDLLYMMMGIEGSFIRVKRGRLKDKAVTLVVDSTVDSSLQELAKQLLPMCEHYLSVSHFTESRSHFKYGLVNHAFAAALRAMLQDYYAMVAQLEHQFRLKRLSLQGLWFFCQPMMGAMQALSVLVHKAMSRNLLGAGILNLLQSQATAMAGDSAARALIQKLMRAASAPYFGILERWVSAGLIVDPYGEFLIDENKALQKESLSQDYHATYWHQRYSLRQDYPGFLSGYAETILTTGKYLNAVRECGGVVKIPSSNGSHTTLSGTGRPYLDHINTAYYHASAELVKLILDKFDLVGRLRSVKHYFFMDQGDFLVHFMDIAKDELLKKSSAIIMEKLQSLLELALRTSVSAGDPYNDDLICNVEKFTLLAQLQNTITSGIVSSDLNGVSEPFMVNSRLSGSPLGSQGAAVNVTGMETFSLDYKVRWPLSLVISRKALTKYQLIFRHLFHFKHVERQLCVTWQAHQATRHLSFKGTAITQSYVLCQRMLHFLQSIEHYMTFEVLEPNWHIMETKILSEKSVDEIIQQHDTFLDKCLRECMLLWPSILKKIEALKIICQQYATATQWLIPTMNTPASGGAQREPRGRSNSKFRRSKQLLYSQPTWKIEDEANFRSTLGGIDKKFKSQLKELISMLSTHSQTEPCFAHLAHALQGDVQGRIGFAA